MEQTKEIIKQVKNIEISTKRLVDGLMAGNYHSIFKGQGIEFSEIRDYRIGDDIRAIDWKVTARLDHPYIKDFIEERDLHIYFVFDYSASGNFGNVIEKKRKAIELTAALMFAALKNNDNVGLFIFTSSVEMYIPARKGRRHILKLIRLLVSHQPKAKNTNIQQSLIHISHVIKKRSVVFIISDFLDSEYMQPLKLLKNKHDVIALKVNDPREYQIPDIGLIRLEDEETGEQILVDTSDDAFREKYHALMKNAANRVSYHFIKNKIDVVPVSTHEPYEKPLRAFFKRRKKRKVR